MTDLVGERRAHPDPGDRGGCLQGHQRMTIDHLSGHQIAPVLGLQRVSVHHHIVDQYPSEDPVAQVANRRATVLSNVDHDAAVLGVLIVHDDLLRNIHQTAREVTRVGRPQGGVGQALASAVGRDEILQYRQSFEEVRLDRARDDVSLRIGHQAAHPGDLAYLHHVPAGTRGHHHVDGVEQAARQGLPHRSSHRLGGFGPDLDQFLPELVIGDDPLLVLLVELVGLALETVDDALLVPRGQHIAQPDGQARPGGVLEPEFLDLVEGTLHDVLVVPFDDLGDQNPDVALEHLGVENGEVPRQCPVQQGPPERGLDQLVAVDRLVGDQMRDEVLQFGMDFGVTGDVVEAELDRRVQRQLTEVVRHHRLVEIGERPARTLDVGYLLRQVVDAYDHVLGRSDDRSPAGRREYVVGGQHEQPRLGLCLGRQGKVHGHLVPIEVGVERLAHQRVYLDGLALDQDRLESLYPQPVKGGRPVQQHRVLLDHLLEHIPDLGPLPLHHPLGGLDVLGDVPVDQPLHHEKA